VGAKDAARPIEFKAREGRSLLELPGALPQPWYGKRPDMPRYTIR